MKTLALRWFFVLLDEKSKIVWEIREENFNRKIVFLPSFEKVVAKIEPSEITLFFFNKFPISAGGGVPYVPRGGAYEDQRNHQRNKVETSSPKPDQKFNS